MKILVTGGAGFIGSHTVDILISGGHSVSVIDNLSNGKKKNLNKNATFFQADITEDDIKKIFRKENPEAVIHMAAHINLRKSIENPLFDAKQNILGTMNVLEASAESGVKRIIYSSTAAIYGEPKHLPVDEKHPANPQSPYGLDKYAAEKYIEMFHEMHGIGYSILRYSNVYGPRQDPLGEAGVISIFIEKMLDGKRPEIFGNGNQTRDFVYVGDVSNANLLAVNHKDNFICNIGTGKETSVNSVFESIRKIANSKIEPLHSAPKKEVQRICFDITKAKEMLGWKPQTSLEEGLKKTVEYFRKNG